MDVTAPTRSTFSVNGHHSGFTLIELVIALTIATLVLAMAIPGINELMADTRLSNTLNSLVGDLHYARAEAIKRRQWVTICKSGNGTTCNSQVEWDDGWVTFVDINRDRQRDSTEPLLEVQSAMEPAVSVDFGSFYSSNLIVYYPNGRSPGNGTFTFCDNGGNAQPKALVFYRGRMRADDTMPDGSPLTCP